MSEKEFEFEVKTPEDIKEAIFNSMVAVIRSLKQTGLKSGSMNFEFLDAKCEIKIEVET